jgi:arsenate reductase-like glutaredoxin family protein
MKAKTKKRVWKFIGKTLFFLLKLVFYYPFQAIVWLLIKLYLFIKRWRSNYKNNKDRPRQGAQVKFFHLIKTYKGNLKHFQKVLFTNKSTIGLILGARGTGKTALGMRLLENFKAETKKKIYALGFSKEALPEWITSIKGIEEIENGSVILMDEGGIEFSSRNAMSNVNKILSELLLISRHKDVSVIFITQNSSNLEINVIRQADYLLLKPSSLLQRDFERSKIKEIYEEVEEDFKKLKNEKGLTYIYSEDYRGFVSNTLPSFWGEKVSKGYAHKKSKVQESKEAA